MSKFIRKNCAVEAVLWTGGSDQLDDPEWLIDAIKKGTDANEALAKAKGHYGQFEDAAEYVDPREK